MDVELALQQLERQLADARPVPLSASVMVNRGDVEQLVAALRTALPEEIRQARWVLKERDELLAQAAREAEQIVGDGRLERERILSETEVVRAAERDAERIVTGAHEEARRLRLEAEDYIDGRLANFEIVLQKTQKTIEKGRERLRGRTSADEQLSGELPAQPAPVDAGRGRRAAPPAGPGPLPAGGTAAASAPPAPDRGRQFYDHETM